MTLAAGRSFVIRVQQINGVGTPWIVRLYHKGLILKRRVSSDWFLDEDQAKRFAEQISGELTRDGATVELIRSRKPGWTLRQPSH